MGTNYLVILISLFVMINCIRQPPAYNVTWSKTLNAYSAITHCDKNRIVSWNCKICKLVQTPQSIYYELNDATHIMLYSGYLKSINSYIISFRGTVDAVNWIQDFSYQFAPYQYCKGCKIHSGFYASVLSIFKPLFDQLKKAQQKYGSNLKIIVTGSSLGAALASIASLELKRSSFNVVQTHTFGNPRFANQALANYLSQKLTPYIRVIHNADIVPHVPLQSQDYHHAPYEIFFDEDFLSYRICDNTGEDPTCSNAFKTFSIPDHVNYWYKPTVQDQCTP